MSLYRRGNVWWSRMVVDGAVHQFTTKAHSKNAARAIEAARRTELAKGRAGLTCPTFSTFLTRFINAQFGRVSKETLRFYLCHLKPLCEFPGIMDCPLDRIDAALVQDFIQWRRKPKRIATTTVNHNLRTLRRVLHLAAEWNVLQKVPKIRLLPNENQRDYVLSDEAVERFSQDSGLIGRLVPVLVDTGLRRSEAVNAKWEDVNFVERWLYIPKGKTKMARRKIPLTKRALQVLTVLKTTAKTDYIFTLRAMDRITGDWLSHAFLDGRRKLSLPDECVLHSTRHTFCSRLGEKGASAFEIQRLAGHSSITISSRYVHTKTDRLDAAIALLD